MSRRTWIARRNLRLYRRRVVALCVIVVGGSALASGSLAVVGQASAGASDAVAQDVVLRSIEVHSDPTRPEVRALRPADLAALSSVPHVTSVEPWLQASFGIKSKTVPGVLLYATVPEPSALPPVTHAVRDKLFPLGAGEVVVPATAQGSDLSVLLGQSVDVDYTKATGSSQGTSATAVIHVVGVYDPAYAADGPAAAYADPALVVELAAARAGVPPADFTRTVGYDRATVLVAHSGDVSATLAGIRDQGFEAVSVQERLKTLPAGLSLLRVVGLALLALLLLYSVVSGSALSGSFVSQRTREIGLLSALGFDRRGIRAVFLTELAIVGGAAAVLGLVSGLIAAVVAGLVFGGRTVAGVELPTGVGLPAWWVLLALLVAPAAAVVLGGLAPATRAARLSPDDALRDG